MPRRRLSPVTLQKAVDSRAGVSRPAVGKQGVCDQWFETAVRPQLPPQLQVAGRARSTLDKQPMHDLHCCMRNWLDTLLQVVSCSCAQSCVLDAAAAV
jgi:hypothetical protein